MENSVRKILEKLFFEQIQPESKMGYLELLKTQDLLLLSVFDREACLITSDHAVILILLSFINVSTQNEAGGKYMLEVFEKRILNNFIQRLFNTSEEYQIKAKR